MGKLEKHTTQNVVSLRKQKLIKMEKDNFILAVYDFWPINKPIEVIDEKNLEDAQNQGRIKIKYKRK